MLKRKIFPVVIAAAVAFSFAGCGETAGNTENEETSEAEETAVTVEAADTEEAAEPEEITLQAVYLGVENYGAEETNKEHRDDFRYRFEIDGEEKVYPVDNGNDYEIQNHLKEGYLFEIALADDTVTRVEEIKDGSAEPYVPPVSGTPGERTLLNFLKTAMEPVGTTLYIYGGGWDWQDEGSSVQTRTLGVSNDWVDFFGKQTKDYTYKDEEKPETSFYPFGEYNEYYYAGLDCSGYLGWALYNTFETADGKDGYVGGSTGFAKRLSEKGWGTWTQDVANSDLSLKADIRPGDIMSLNGHVWISLGTCDDGSVVIAHSSPTDSRTGQPGGGVQLSAVGGSRDCEAYRLASEYMSRYFPEWSERYEAALKAPGDYFVFDGENAGLFSWDTADAPDGLTDPDGIQGMKPKDVLSLMF